MKIVPIFIFQHLLLTEYPSFLEDDKRNSKEKWYDMYTFTLIIQDKSKIDLDSELLSHYCYFATLMLTYFHLMKGHVTVF